MNAEGRLLRQWLPPPPLMILRMNVDGEQEGAPGDGASSPPQGLSRDPVQDSCRQTGNDESIMSKTRYPAVLRRPLAQMGEFVWR